MAAYIKKEVIGNATLYLGDCMQVMAGYPDNHFDLAIVDPQYGLGTKNQTNNKTRSNKAPAKLYKPYPDSKQDRPGPEYFAELARVAKNRIIWGANHLCGAADLSGPGWIVWDKHATGDFSDGEIAASTFDRPLRIFSYTWNGMLQGSHGDKRKNEIRIHPSQKPIALYMWLLRNYSAPGQLVFDSHLGSGSSAIAAYYCGVEFTGTEIDPDYFADMLNRYRQETSQIAIAGL
jgi:site-specific DNA-methyltransferase (adenine-specific)